MGSFTKAASPCHVPSFSFWPGGVLVQVHVQCSPCHRLRKWPGFHPLKYSCVLQGGNPGTLASVRRKPRLSVALQRNPTAQPLNRAHGRRRQGELEVDPNEPSIPLGPGRGAWSNQTIRPDPDLWAQKMGHVAVGSKPMGSHFGIGEFTHFRTYFGGDWMFTRGTIWILTHGHVFLEATCLGTLFLREIPGEKQSGCTCRPSCGMISRAFSWL